MSRPPTRYVLVARELARGRWRQAVHVTRERPAVAANDVALFEVDGVPSADAATGAVIEWLVRGRQGMTVAQLWPADDDGDGPAGAPQLRAHGRDYHRRPPGGMGAGELAAWHAGQHHRHGCDHDHAGPNVGPFERPPGWRTGEGMVPKH